MAQHDYSIANQGFPATRGDINDALDAIKTTNSGTSAPSTQFAGQFWLDTNTPSGTTWTLYFHDGTDDITFATIDTSANTINFTDSTLEPTADTSAGDNAAIGYTSAEGLILTGQGSTSDVTIKNDADATVLSIPTGTSNVGIGTTTPSEALEVNGTIKATALDVTGTILQVVNSTVGMTDIAGTDAYIGAGCSITPSSTSSKIQIFVDGYVEKITGVTATYAQLALYEDTTGITTLSNAITYLYTVGARVPFSINFTRSPSTTSAVQYRLYNDEQSGGATYRYYQQAWTLMEVAG